jgi:hypothetical protein
LYERLALKGVVRDILVTMPLSDDDVILGIQRMEYVERSFVNSVRLDVVAIGK